MVNFLVGNRTEESGRVFLTELSSRLGCGKPLFTSDELKVYASLLLEIYHETVVEEPTGKRGRPRNPRIIPHVDLDYATVHKTRDKGRVVKVERKIIYGDAKRISVRLEDSPSHIINTSYMERMNGILRQMNAHLKRKALTFAKSLMYFNAKLSLIVAVYNFVRPHGTLSKNADRSTTPRTPAMVAGITTHPWSFIELLGIPYVCNVYGTLP
jgi:IS1 family transposase